MTALAAHLIDEVIPKVPTRQWVLSFPIRLRYLMAYNHELCREVLAIFVRVVTQFYRQQAEADGVTGGKTGSVTFVQRSGGALNLNVHFHTVFIDGVFADAQGEGKKGLSFHPLSEITDQQAAVILSQIRYEILCHLRDKGLLAYDYDTDSLADKDPLLAACYDASVQNRIAFGSRAGQKVTRLGADPYAEREASKVERRGKPQAHLDGFDLHARQHIHANDREQLERTLRYCARPPISEDRLDNLIDGRIRLTLRTPYNDGTTHLALEPLELLERLAAIIPRPRVNLLFYHGVFASNAKLRKAVVAYGKEPPKPEVTPAIEQKQLDLFARFQAEVNPDRPTEGSLNTVRSNCTWASLMQRAFKVDILKCDKCNGRLRFIACITKPAAIGAILRCFGLPDTPPEIAPSRSPPMTEYDDTLFAVA
jgi:hypothetical protein